MKKMPISSTIIKGDREDRWVHNLRKFCFDLSLQVQVDVNEATEQHIHSHAMETKETYASWVLRPNQSVHDGEKVLGIL